MRMIVPLALLLLPLAGVAQVDPAPDPGPPPEVDPSAAPLPPKALDSDARAEPTVTITTDEETGQVVEEYALNGTVYMVKVTPRKGVPYYLFDSDGDGSLESRWTEVQGVVDPVYYKPKEWK